MRFPHLKTNYIVTVHKNDSSSQAKTINLARFLSVGYLYILTKLSMQVNKCGLRLIQTNTRGVLGNRERKGETYAPGKGKTAFISTMYLHHLLMSPPPSPLPGPTYSFLPKESNTMETDLLNLISKGASVCWQQLVPKCGNSFKGTNLLKPCFVH